MRLRASIVALALSLPLFGVSSQANAFFFGSDDSYERPRAYYGGPRYTGERRHYRTHRNFRHYRSGRPESYRTGSRRWWSAMDREDRGGRGSRQ